jgi:type IV pilus assembly protein PilO
MAWYNPSSRKQRNALLAAIALLALLYPFRAFWYSGKRAEVDAVVVHVEGLEDKNRAAQVMAARGGADLEERMALYERHVAELEELIPAAEEVAGLLDDVTTQAVQIGVDLQRLIPEPAEVGTFYTKSSYEMSVIGEYHDVARFLTKVASLSRIVTPVEFDVQLFDQAQLYPEYESPILATFRIETYVLPDPNAAPVRAEEQPGVEE